MVLKFMPIHTLSYPEKLMKLNNILQQKD